MLELIRRRNNDFMFGRDKLCDQSGSHPITERSRRKSGNLSIAARKRGGMRGG
jgi:hypothetical protein